MMTLAKERVGPLMQQIAIVTHRSVTGCQPFSVSRFWLTGIDEQESDTANRLLF